MIDKEHGSLQVRAPHVPMAPSRFHEDSESKEGVEDVHYTVFVRLPFARGNFEDPPPVCG